MRSLCFIFFVTVYTFFSLQAGDTKSCLIGDVAIIFPIPEGFYPSPPPLKTVANPDGSLQKTVLAYEIAYMDEGPVTVNFVVTFNSLHESMYVSESDFATAISSAKEELVQLNQNTLEHYNSIDPSIQLTKVSTEIISEDKHSISLSMSSSEELQNSSRRSSLTTLTIMAIKGKIFTVTLTLGRPTILSEHAEFIKAEALNIKDRITLLNE